MSDVLGLVLSILLVLWLIGAVVRCKYDFAYEVSLYNFDNVVLRVQSRAGRTCDDRDSDFASMSMR